MVEKIRNNLDLVLDLLKLYFKNIFLDLSFNNIEKIEGLENLNKLKDISLFNNQISKLENMNNLEHLEVFSIGNNQLSDYSNVKLS